MKNATETTGRAEPTMCRTSWKFSEKSENFPKKVLTNTKSYAIINSEIKERGNHNEDGN
jgi:hypothetical protein